MSLNPRCLALNQITSLVQSVNKKNYKSTCTELSTLVERYESDAERHLFRSLLSLVEFPSDGRPAVAQDEHQVQLLVQEIGSVMSKPNFASLLCHGFEHSENKTVSPTANMLQNVCKGLRLTKVQEVVLALGLTHSFSEELKQQATSHLKTKLLELLKVVVDTDPGQGVHESGLTEVSPEVLHTLLLYLLHRAQEDLGLSQDTVEAFVATIRRDFPLDRVPVVLSPLLYRGLSDITEDRLVSTNISQPSSASQSELNDLFKELGYSVTMTKDTVLQHLSDLGVKEITPKCVAKLLGMMAATHSSLTDSVSLQVGPDEKLNQDPPPAPPTWNVEAFVDAVKVKCPSLSWREVVLELDHPEFYLSDMEGLRIVIQAYRAATVEEFPVEALYRMWSNTRGQLSWISHALSGCPDFSFADFPCRQVTMGMQRSMPEDETKNIRTWTSLDLIETLLNLSEAGHFEEVHQLFNFPLKHCPDILLFGVLQSKPIWHTMQHELLCFLVPFFMANHPNSASVLHFAWQGAASDPSVVRQLMSNAIADWYLHTDSPQDHSKLSRVLDVMQDLKALFTLLNNTQFSFVVDLACLAAKREYLKLDTWIVDRIREHQEQFITACIAFLTRKAPSPVVSSTDTRSSLSHDIVVTVLSCLQPYLSTLPTEWAEKLRALIQIHGPIPVKVAPPPSYHSDSPRETTPFGGLTGDGAGLGGFPSSRATSNGSPLKLQGLWGPDSPTGDKGSPLSGGSTKQQVFLQPQGPSDAWTEPISKEAEEQANAYFQAVYHGNMSVDQLLHMLKGFRTSTNKKEREVFTCMLKNMFDEYKFFPQFPDKELQITGQLFGGIIDQGLVNYMMLGMALRHVLDALRKQPMGKMFLFGLAALDKFKSKLKDYAQYCSAIANVPHFNQIPSSLQQYVEYGRHSMLPPSVAGASSHFGEGTPGVLHVLPPPPSSGSTSPLVPLYPPMSTGSAPASPQYSPGGSGRGSATGSPVLGHKDRPLSILNTANIDTLLGAVDSGDSFPEPSEALQDRIHFIFNNLSANNLGEKAAEFKDLVQEEHYGWVARYLVIKRVSSEQNFHTLYMSFLDTLEVQPLEEVILRETYRNIKVLLQADKSSNSFSDRTMLKSLGHWLGMLTLAKSRPLLYTDVAIKELLLEAYRKERQGQQELLYVVPFVAKVLECAAESKVFKPPNPWVMAIMRVLVELHAKPDLQLNLKFEIEVLCKNLGLELADIKPSQLLGLPEAVRRPQLYSPPPGQPAEEFRSPNMHPPHTVPRPLFHYEDISIASLAGLSQHIEISPQIPLLVQYPQMKPCVRQAVEKAVQDYANPVLDRSIKIVLTTTEQVIKKDFALNPDENVMRTAAHNMVRHLAAGMAMITCREPLLLAISTNLKSAFTGLLRPGPEEQKVMIEQASQQLSADNTELACAFIQKMAVEKAITEMDKRLSEEFESRKQARSEGRRYINPAMMQYQAERLPEQLRSKATGVTSSQFAVYEEFARCLPGFLPSATPTATTITPGAGLSGGDELVTLLDKCIQEISQCLWSVMSMHSSNPHVMMMTALLDHIRQLRINRHIYTAMQLLQKTLENLLEGMNPPPSDPDLFIKFRDSHVLVLRILQDQHAFGPAMAKKQVTQMLMECRDELKYSARAIVLLIGIQLVDMKALDQHLAKAIESGRNLIALSCSIKLINALTVAERSERPLTDADLRKTKEVLVHLASNIRHLPESSAQLLENFRVEMLMRTKSAPEMEPPPPATPTGMSQVHVSRNMDDPPGLHERVEGLLSEWVRHYHVPGRTWDADKLYAAYVARLQQSGIFKSEELITRFFRISVEMCVDLCYRTLGDQSISSTLARAKCYHTMDAFVKLVVVLVRFSGDSTNHIIKVNLLNKVLITVAAVLLQDQEARGADFHQLPYHRFFVMLLNDLSSPDVVFDAISLHVMQAFCTIYHSLNPSVTPGFAYSWLELVSHRIFVSRLLVQTPQQKGWPLFQMLLIDLFTFLSPFLRNADLGKATQLLYKGTLRVLLVLLHDFPEFLCEYHFSFCDVIPPNCIQMRNLILSAFPRNMRLPDPFTPNLKVETLPDIAHAPTVVSSYVDSIPPSVHSLVEEQLKGTADLSAFMAGLSQEIKASAAPGKQYRTSLVNALTLYLGTQAIDYLHSINTTPSVTMVIKTTHFALYKQMILELDTEGRYLLLNAVANQLRYPNSHTHYFSCCLLALFSETNTEAIQEQITRVLLERLIVNRPHPWGLLVTFIELIKNPLYNFWNHEFVHCAPEIKKLFDSVARSCMQKQTPMGREHDQGPAVSVP